MHAAWSRGILFAKETAMDLEKNKLSGQFKWYVIIICITTAAVVLLTIFTDIFQAQKASLILQLIPSVVSLIILAALLFIIPSILKAFGTLGENGARLDKIVEATEKNLSILAQINQSTRLSETAKAIASREADRQSLREAVLEKLHQQDFNGTYEIIDEIAHATVYKELAEQLRTEADKYRAATDAERLKQVIAHIEKLFENYQWLNASTLIEKLIKTDPAAAEKGKELRQKLVDKKQERKKVLLSAWDDAIRRQATDRSLEILRELDQYLTPNEGLALQEAARDIFKSKLHSLGVRFSLAVSGKQWDKAMETGNEIMRDFPNSRMAEEIREKIDILKQKVQ